MMTDDIRYKIDDYVTTGSTTLPEILYEVCNTVDKFQHELNKKTSDQSKFEKVERIGIYTSEIRRMINNYEETKSPHKLVGTLYKICQKIDSMEFELNRKESTK